MGEVLRHEPAGLERWLLEQWSLRFGQALESMTGQPVQVETASPAVGCEAPADLLWWEQPLRRPPAAAVWVGAVEAVRTRVGGRILEAAGLESTSSEDCRCSYLEVLQHTFASFGQALAGLFGGEVVCDTGREGGEQPASPRYLCAVQFPDNETVEMWLSFSRELLEAALHQVESAAAETEASPSRAGPPAGANREEPDTGRTMDLLYDVELPVSISFGRAHLPLKQVLKLTSGSIVELNRTVSEPVEVIVNNCVVARGEVVVIDGNYGVRITQIVSRRERLRTLH